MMSKMWITVFWIPLLLLLQGRIVDSETFQPVLVIPFTPSQDVEYDDYIVYDLLEKALVSPFNLYKLRKTFLSDDLILCLPVTYHLHCENKANCSSSINCSGNFPFSQSYLWTLFNTESFAGKILLDFIENRLKSSLLGLPHHFCSFSATNGIFLYLNVESFPCLQGNVSTEDVISRTLVQITGRLDGYASSNGQSTVTAAETPGGYGLRWTNSTEHSFIKDTSYSNYYFSIPVIAVAIWIGIYSNSEVFEFFGRRLKERKAHFLAFWSFQCVIVVVNILNMIYIIKSDPNGAQSYIVTVGTLICVIGYEIYFQNDLWKKNVCQNTPTEGSNRTETHDAELDGLLLKDGDANKDAETDASQKCSSGAAVDTQQNSITERDSEQKIVSKDSDASTAVNIDDMNVPCTSWKCCSDKKSCHKFTKYLFVFIATVNSFLFFVFLAYTLPWLVLGFYLYPIKVLVRIGFLFAATLCLMLNSAWVLRNIEKLALDSDCHSQQCQSIINSIKNVLRLVTSVSLLAALVFMGIIVHHIVYNFSSDNNPTFEELLTILPGLIIPVVAYVIHGKVNLAQILDIKKKKEINKVRLDLTSTV